jgi:hypothetical protein
MQMEATRFAETLVFYRKTKRRHNPENLDFNYTFILKIFGILIPIIYRHGAVVQTNYSYRN